VTRRTIALPTLLLAILIALPAFIAAPSRATARAADPPATPSAPATPAVPATPSAPATGRTKQAETAGDWRVDRDHWFLYTLDGKPCGRLHEQTLTSKEGSLRRSIVESTLRLGRAGQSVEIEVRTTFDETPNGEPRAAEVRQSSGGAPVELVYAFDPSDRTKVHVISTQGGRVTDTAQTLSDANWLTPIAAEAFADARRAAGAAEYTVRTIDLSTGLTLVERTAKREGEGRFTIGDREIPTTRWTERDSVTRMPVSTEWSTDGVMVRSSMTLPFGRLEAALSDASSVRDVLRAPAVEVMVNTLTRPDRPIPNPGETGVARFRVRTANGDPLELPSTGAQQATRRSPDALEVVVDVSRASPATEAELADARFRDANLTIDSGDESVRAFAAKTLAPLRDATPRERAEALRRAVHRHVNRKGMSTAFATASETIRSREGDCTEHAVLLAALLRAEGIPSRVVTGLVYCTEFAGERNVFGWHMWTQALLDGRWVDFDATLDGREPFHAAHIATGTSAHEHGPLDSEWAALVALIGNLRIEVLETAPRSRTDE